MIFLWPCRWARRACFAILLSLICLAGPLPARQRWITVTTSHFEMYTDESEKRAIDALQTFEQVRYFFLKGSSHKDLFDGRVRIIAFSSEKEFRPYRFNGGAFAYYQQSRERDYIVMQDIEPDHSQAAVHEYTHLVIQHLKLELPLWLNEGMADVYSSLEPKGKKAMVGRPLAGHSLTLGSRRWMNWNTLFAVSHDSPYYNVPDMMQLFYAQSWVLTHMLELSPAYSGNFAKFLGAIAGGASAPDAFSKVYGKTVDQVAADVQNYVRQTTVKAAIFDVSLAKGDLDPQIADVSPFDLELALAELLSTNQSTAREARNRLLDLEKQNPNNQELELSMGYLAWQEGKSKEAAQHFKSAIDNGLKDPTVMYHYVQLIQGTGAAADQTEPLLEQVVSKQPENIEARLFLASTAANARHLSVAMGALYPVKHVDPEHAYDFFRINAFVHFELRDYPGAKANAEQALPYAKTPSQRLEVENLLGNIELATAPTTRTVAAAAPPESAPSPAPEPSAPAATSHRYPQLAGLPRVEGKTKAFECLEGGAYRLHIRTGAREMIFSFPRDPRNVMVQNTPNAMTLFTCGPLKPQNVTVVYTPSEGKSDGVVAELIY